MSDTPAALRWRALVDEHRSSGLTCRAFAEARNLNPSTFAWWRAELRRRGRDQAEQPATFTALTVARPVGHVVLQLENHGARVVVDRDTDLDLLRQLLVALA